MFYSMLNVQVTWYESFWRLNYSLDVLEIFKRTLVVRSKIELEKTWIFKLILSFLVSKIVFFGIALERRTFVGRWRFEDRTFLSIHASPLLILLDSSPVAFDLLFSTPRVAKRVLDRGLERVFCSSVTFLQYLLLVVSSASKNIYFCACIPMPFFRFEELLRNNW